MRLTAGTLKFEPTNTVGLKSSELQIGEIMTSLHTQNSVMMN